MVSLTTFSTVTVGIVALVSAVLMVLTWIAANRTGQRRVRFVAAAFGVHAAKSTIVAAMLVTRALGHEAIELIEAVFDLAMVTLMFIPFWTRG